MHRFPGRTPPPAGPRSDNARRRSPATGRPGTGSAGRWCPWPGPRPARRSRIARPRAVGVLGLDQPVAVAAAEGQPARPVLSLPAHQAPRLERAVHPVGRDPQELGTVAPGDRPVRMDIVPRPGQARRRHRVVRPEVHDLGGASGGVGVAGLQAVAQQQGRAGEGLPDKAHLAAGVGHAPVRHGQLEGDADDAVVRAACRPKAGPGCPGRLWPGLLGRPAGRPARRRCARCGAPPRGSPASFRSGGAGDTRCGTPVWTGWLR